MNLPCFVFRYSTEKLCLRWNRISTLLISCSELWDISACFYGQKVTQLIYDGTSHEFMSVHIYCKTMLSSRFLEKCLILNYFLFPMPHAFCLGLTGVNQLPHYLLNFTGFPSDKESTLRSRSSSSNVCTTQLLNTLITVSSSVYLTDLAFVPVLMGHCCQNLDHKTLPLTKLSQLPVLNSGTQSQPTSDH